MISDKLHALSNGTFQVLETLNGSTHLLQDSVTTSWDRRELWSQWSTTILSRTPGPRSRTCTSPGTRLPWPTSTTSSSSSVGALLRRSLGQVIFPFTFSFFKQMSFSSYYLKTEPEYYFGYLETGWLARLPHDQVVMPITTYLFSLGLLAKSVEWLCQFKKLHKTKSECFWALTHFPWFWLAFTL